MFNLLYLFIVLIKSQRVTILHSSFLSSDNVWYSKYDNRKPRWESSSLCPSGGSCQHFTYEDEIYTHIDTTGYTDIEISYDVRTEGLVYDETFELWWSLDIDSGPWDANTDMWIENDNPCNYAVCNVGPFSASNYWEDTAGVAIEFIGDFGVGKHAYLNNVLVTGISSISIHPSVSATASPTSSPTPDPTPTTNDPSVVSSTAPSAQPSSPISVPSVDPTAAAFPSLNIGSTYMGDDTTTKQAQFKLTSSNPSVDPSAHPTFNDDEAEVIEETEDAKYDNEDTQDSGDSELDDWLNLEFILAVAVVLVVVCILCCAILRKCGKVTKNEKMMKTEMQQDGNEMAERNNKEEEKQASEIKINDELCKDMNDDRVDEMNENAEEDSDEELYERGKATSDNTTCDNAKANDELGEDKLYKANDELGEDMNDGRDDAMNEDSEEGQVVDTAGGNTTGGNITGGKMANGDKITRGDLV